jgi:hypothetical protein
VIFQANDERARIGAGADNSQQGAISESDKRARTRRAGNVIGDSRDPEWFTAILGKVAKDTIIINKIA